MRALYRAGCDLSARFRLSPEVASGQGRAPACRAAVLPLRGGASCVTRRYAVLSVAEPLYLCAVKRRSERILEHFAFETRLVSTHHSGETRGFRQNPRHFVAAAAFASAAQFQAAAVWRRRSLTDGDSIASEIALNFEMCILKVTLLWGASCSVFLTCSRSASDRPVRTR
ncbi:hypothetical protein KL86DES1_20927 [uncultured Desulfovibrio sp.]|uniref:Uncharacterized protein n=1 Tax=uncultured Desulfovibrio sp. TaxID=167968 RepID=A0A212L5T8_9BACT|nr:hypothetical protein KL86DES1_20927 [uncultured Desulfovibrio sp.]VZH33830.1 conserved protein of unknown function [Desulfovibrio sp. 86]